MTMLPSRKTMNARTGFTTNARHRPGSATSYRETPASPGSRSGRPRQPNPDTPIPLGLAHRASPPTRISLNRHRRRRAPAS